MKLVDFLAVTYRRRQILLKAVKVVIPVTGREGP
jgi:hypothetical protein